MSQQDLEQTELDLDLDTMFGEDSRYRRRKTRRGKRKYRNKKGGLQIYNEGFTDFCVQCKSMSATKSDSSKKLFRKGRVSRTNKSKLAPILRPRYSPKAPQNFNQFLMDDHVGHSCEFLGFESPDPFGERHQLDMYSPEKVELFTDLGDDQFQYKEDQEIDASTCTRKSAIDHQEDTIAFMEQDFERAYSSVKVEHLENMSKVDLVNVISQMEEKAEKLEKELEQRQLQESGYSVNESSSLIDQLQTENLNLYEENKLLKQLIQQKLS